MNTSQASQTAVRFTLRSLYIVLQEQANVIRHLNTGSSSTTRYHATNFCSGSHARVTDSKSFTVHLYISGR